MDLGHIYIYIYIRVERKGKEVAHRGFCQGQTFMNKPFLVLGVIDGSGDSFPLHWHLALLFTPGRGKHIVSDGYF